MSDTTTAPAVKQSTRWGARLGLAGFAFFTIKGVAWLTVPIVAAYWMG